MGSRCIFLGMDFGNKGMIKRAVLEKVRAAAFCLQKCNCTLAHSLKAHYKLFAYRLFIYEQEERAK